MTKEEDCFCVGKMFGEMMLQVDEALSGDFKSEVRRIWESEGDMYNQVMRVIEMAARCGADPERRVLPDIQQARNMGDARKFLKRVQYVPAPEACGAVYESVYSGD